MLSVRILLLLSLITTLLCSQNTVGLISYSPWANSYEGLNLMYPHSQPDAFLFDNCGRLINRWDGEEDTRNGNTCYITDDGHLIKTVRKDEGFAFIWEDKGDTKVECRTWDNDLLWSFSLRDSTTRLHHDIEPTPYGTVFMIAWDHHTLDEAIALGRDSSLMSQQSFSPDKIIEYDPELDSIVWEWRAWDHLIQDRDSLKPNYGVISDHPERINLNWENNELRADWMHVNAIDYNPGLDQIMINVPTFNEIWIIDHSTTTNEASSSTGGLSNRGGDILWRWGHPMAYNSGDEEDQKLFFQHDALWAQDHLDMSNSHYGSISVFNNKVDPSFSSIGLIKPIFDTLSWSYRMVDDVFMEDFYYEWQHKEPDVISSVGLSSVQVLPNEHLLVCSGNNGLMVELNKKEDIVWSYKTPFKDGEIIEQGRELSKFDNRTFRVRRYPPSYPGFVGKDMTSKAYLELDPNEAFCEKALAINRQAIDQIELKQSHDYIELAGKDLLGKSVSTYNMMGELLHETRLLELTHRIEIGHLTSGYYVLILDNRFSMPFVITR